jgi:site-specific recombinase XerD
MGRKRRGPWQRKSGHPDRNWYATINRKAIKLGTSDEPWETIERRYGIELAKVEKPSQWSVVGIIDRFLEHSKRKNSPGTYEFYRGPLEDFRGVVDTKLSANDLDPDVVSDWVDDRYGGLSDSTRANAIRCVIRAMNWAVKTKKLKANPISGIERPMAGSREVFLSFDQFIEVAAHFTDREFLDVLFFLWHTGSRPQEFRVIEARHVSDKVVTLDRKLSKGKRHKRKIWLNDGANEIVTRLCRRYSEGPIFRNTRGKPWKRDQLSSRFFRLRAKMKKEKVKDGTWEADREWVKGLCPYVLRHSYAQRMLKAGVDSIKLGVLMGHADPSQIARTYQHLIQDDEHMLEVANPIGALA